MWPQTVSLVEEAVLPPQKGEILSGGEVEGESIEGKEEPTKVSVQKEDV